MGESLHPLVTRISDSESLQSCLFARSGLLPAGTAGRPVTQVAVEGAALRVEPRLQLAVEVCARVLDLLYHEPVAVEDTPLPLAKAELGPQLHWLRVVENSSHLAFIVHSSAPAKIRPLPITMRKEQITMFFSPPGYRCRLRRRESLHERRFHVCNPFFIASSPLSPHFGINHAACRGLSRNACRRRKMDKHFSLLLLRDRSIAVSD